MRRRNRKTKSQKAADRQGPWPAAHDLIDAGDSDAGQRRSPRRLVACLACSSRDIVATGDFVGQVSLWNLGSGQLVAKMPCTEEKKVEMVRFSPGGKWLAYYVEGVLHVVDVSKDVEKPKDK